jgi:hypothetical protein
MIYIKELTDEDEYKINNVPNVIEVKGIPDKKNKVSVRFKLVDVGSLVYESEGLSTNLELRPAKREFGNNVTISWNINLKKTDGNVQMIGFKIQSPSNIHGSPSNALIQKEKNMWKFERDIHGDAHPLEVVNELEISDPKEGGRTPKKTEISVENVKPASTWSLPRLATASLYSPDYPNKSEIMEGKIPSSIVVDGLPEGGNFTGKHVFNLLDSKTLTYRCVLTERNKAYGERAAVILRPAAINFGNIEWEFIRVKDHYNLTTNHLMDDDDEVIGMKRNMWGNIPSILFQKAKQSFSLMSMPEEEQLAYARYQDDLRYEASLVESNYGLGRMEGKEEGRIEGKLEVANRLVEKGMSAEEAAAVAGIPVELLRN